MKRHLVSSLLLAALAAMTLSAFADGPLLTASDKLFGIVAPDGALDESLVQAYEKSEMTAAFVRAEWGKIRPKDSGDGTSPHVFTAFDSQPLLAGGKTVVCIVDMTNPQANAIDRAARIRSAESFVKELTKHTYSKGIRHFWLSADTYAGSKDSLAIYAEDLKALYSSAKAAGNDTLVIAGPAGATEEAVKQFYDAGVNASFDIMAADVCSKDPGYGVDVPKLLKVRETMARSGDGTKKLLVTGNLGEQADTFAHSVYRSILTKRDVSDPNWLIGAALAGKPDAEVLKAFPPEVPEHTFDCSIESAGPVLDYVVGNPYKMTLKFTNSTDKQVKLDRFSADLPDAEGMAVAIKPDDHPKTAEARSSASAGFTITFPKEAAGRGWLVRGSLEYSVDGKSYFTDCYFPAMVSNELELTLLPQKLVIGVESEPKTVGMSVINHLNKLYSGDIILSPYAGIKTSVKQRKMVVDPFGLDAFVFKVEKDPATKPGHYAILVNLEDKIRDWIAVDVALPIRKPTGMIEINGDLGEWKDTEGLTITHTSEDGQARPVGTARFVYDSAALYGAFEIDDAKHVSAAGHEAPQDSVHIAIDPLMNGSRRPDGGFKNDDYLFALRGSDSSPVVVRIDGLPVSGAHIQGPSLAIRNESGKSYYEVAFPWSAIAPLDAKSTKEFGLSVLVNMTDGGPIEQAQWGGGLIPRIDPRAFMPAVLVQ